MPASRTGRTTTARITTAVVGLLVVGAAATTVVAVRPAGGAPAPGAPAPAAPASAASAAPSDAAPSNALPSDPVPGPQATTVAPLESAAPIRTDLVAEVTDLRAVQGRAAQPGEVAGPAVRFTITLRNTTDAAFDLSNAVVNAVSGTDAEPAYPLSEPGGRPFPASVPAGGTVSGVYVFAIPTDRRRHVTVTLDTSTATPVVAFTGDAPR